MSHEVETMAYEGDLPWHGLGKKVRPDLTPQEMLKKAGLDWEVTKTPNITVSPDGEIVPIKDKPYLMRTSDNTVLSQVSPDWNIVQNHEAFDFFYEYVEAGKMQMHTAGSLYKGRMVWALARLTDAGFGSFCPVPGDHVEPYLLFTNPHEYGKSVSIMFTPIRVVCHNTLTYALNKNERNKDDALAAKSPGRISYNHSCRFDPARARQDLDMVIKQFNEHKQSISRLAERPFTMDEFLEYLQKLFPRSVAKTVGKDDFYSQFLIEKGMPYKHWLKSGRHQEYKEHSHRSQGKPSQIDRILNQHLVHQPGREYAEGTWWHAYNTISYFTDHIAKTSQDSRLYSAWYGDNKYLKIRAYKLAEKMSLSERW